MENHYSEQTVQIFEIMTCYFADLFYNKYYISVKNLYNTKNAKTSITDLYRACAITYAQKMKDDMDYYAKTLKDMFNLHMQYTSSSCVTIGSFETRVLDNFLPEKYINVLNSNQITYSLRKVIHDIMTNLTNYVLDVPVLNTIINTDIRGLTKSIQTVKSKFFDIIADQREIIHANFSKRLLGKTKSSIMSEKMVKLRDDYKNVTRNKIIAEETCKILLAENADLRKRIQSMTTQQPKHQPQSILRKSNINQMITDQKNEYNDKIQLLLSQPQPQPQLSQPQLSQPQLSQLSQLSQPQLSQPLSNLPSFTQEPELKNVETDFLDLIYNNTNSNNNVTNIESDINNNNTQQSAELISYENNTLNNLYNFENEEQSTNFPKIDEDLPF